MSHLDGGTILTLRDGGPIDADAREHLDECAACTEALSEARHRAEAVARLLGSLDDGPPVDVEAAKKRVRRRLDARRDAAPRRAPAWTRALGRAAILLLAVSGVVYALPSSPFRGWIESMGSSGPVDTPPAVEGVAESIEIAVPSEGLRITLGAMRPGERIDVRWTEATTVSVMAPPGSRYSVSSGVVGVDVTPGTVQVTLPRAGGPITLEAGGRMMMRSVAGDVEVGDDVIDRDADRIVLSAPSR